MMQPLTTGERQTLAFFIGALLALLLIGVAFGSPSVTPERDGHRVIDGVVTEVVIAPCNDAVGPGMKTGAHFVVVTSGSDTLNVHLGPVAFLSDELTAMGVGSRIGIRAFERPGLPANHVVAAMVWTEDEVYRLRDAETLIPRWSESQSAPGGEGRRSEGPCKRGAA
jgi:hypothetical protein